MDEQRFTTSLTPHITVEACAGDLAIAAAAEPEVIIALEGDDGDIQREGETLRMRSGGDCRITCPPASTVTLRGVGGDLSVSDLGGTLAVESVGGDVSLRGAGMVTIRSAASDVSARDVAGDLRIENVESDLEARRVDGRLIVKSVGGDLSARTLGGFEIDDVGGDASIETDMQAGRTYRAHAGGDLTLRLPPHVSAQFQLSAGGEIEKRVEFTEWQGNAHAGQGLMGSGEARVELSAGGDLMLLPLRSDTDFDFNINFDAIGSEIAAKMGQFEHELEAKMEKLSEQISRMAEMGAHELESRLRRANIEQAGRHAERAAERIREQAERARQHAERAAERARRQAERTRRRAERHGKRHGFQFHVDLTPPGAPSRAGRAAPPPPPPPRAAQPAATEEERLMILHMLEQRKISADEADRLLNALEG